MVLPLIENPKQRRMRNRILHIAAAWMCCAKNTYYYARIETTKKNTHTFWILKISSNPKIDLELLAKNRGRRRQRNVILWWSKVNRWCRTKCLACVHNLNAGSVRVCQIYGNLNCKRFMSIYTGNFKGNI